MSAVMDGCATPQEWAQVERAWAQDPSLRERWANWQTAADGLCSADLLAGQGRAGDLLDRLHAALPAQLPAVRRRREWLAPFAVAAGFVAMAVGITQLRPAAPPDAGLAAARIETVPMQGLVGTSFAQTASGRTLAPDVVVRDSAASAEAPLEWRDWSPPAGDPAASGPRP
ncbi:hypothetical protein [Roseateles asaccharophilus]|uniref:Negative regulator of sigma E activity n=1 Tax=Roseateles asaccharophilus TaxID=582607 RepID=A0ABU2AC35_9BURK|nr:hypothetical protein [Roseateles asaccharophilus]MDR7334755.1 negative regulator of sigma E activity [Roseateles asaccharophilus]